MLDQREPFPFLSRFLLLIKEYLLLKTLKNQALKTQTIIMFLLTEKTYTKKCLIFNKKMITITSLKIKTMLMILKLLIHTMVKPKIITR